MLAAVSFGVGITTVTKKYLTTLLTGLRLVTVCHKRLFVCARFYVAYCLHSLCTHGTASFNPYTSCVR
jgi:hypothetical protein